MYDCIRHHLTYRAFHQLIVNRQFLMVTKCLEKIKPRHEQAALSLPSRKRIEIVLK
jgi:hypothetical protein